MAGPRTARTGGGKSRDGVETRDDIWYVGCRPAKRKMVCKRDWSVDRGGGSPMTTKGPADVVVSACGHAAPARPVLARHGFRELVCIWPASGEPTLVRAVF